MAVQRKVFSIEQHVRPRLRGAAASGAADQPSDAVSELQRLRTLMEPQAAAEIDAAKQMRAQIAEAQAYKAELATIYDAIGRTAADMASLEAGAKSGAHALAAALKNHERGLVHDIQERVVQIFEVCNFQDLTGQRVSKAVTTLRFIEEHIDRMLEIWQRVAHFKPVTADGGQKGDERRFLNGPKLTGDGGHSTQSEIDEIFVGS